MELQSRGVPLTAIFTAQLTFHILDVIVDSPLSLVYPGEALLPVALMPAAVIVSLIFLPLLGLVAVFKRHLFPPVRILKNLWVVKHKSDANTDILTKQLLSEITFESEVNQVLDNLYNAFFRLFNAQITAKDAFSSPGHTAPESLRCYLHCHVFPLSS